MSSGEILDSTEAGGTAIRGAALRIAGFGTATALSIISAPILVRALGVEAVGQYVLVVAIATVTIGMTDGGLAGIAARELSVCSPQERAPLLRALLGLRLALSLTGALAAVGYALLAGLGSTLVVATALTAVAAVGSSIQAAAGTVLTVDLRYGAQTAGELVRQAATTVGIIALAVAGAGVVAFCGNLVAASAAGLLATFVIAGRSVPWGISVDWGRWRRLLVITVPYALAAAVGTLYLRAGVLLLERMSTTLESGYFGISYRIVEVLFLLPQVMVLATFPILARAARDDRERLVYAVDRQLVTCALGGFLLAFVLWAGAEPIIAIVAGDQGAPAAGPLRWHAAALLLSFLAATASYALLAEGRTWAVLWQNLAALGVVVVASLLLIPDGGATGAAQAAVLAEVALLGMGWGALALGRKPLRPPLKELPRLLVAAAPAVAAGVLLPPLAGTAVGLVVFVAIAFLSRGVPDELIVEARAARKRT